jgi:hypothetical protein
MRRLSRHDLRTIYARTFSDPRRERQFLASLAFFVAFGVARLVAHSIRGEARGSTTSRSAAGTSTTCVGDRVAAVHRLRVAARDRRRPALAPRRPALAALYGIGAALTLDEFALWLNLRDVYWSARGASASTRSRCAGRSARGVLGGPFFPRWGGRSRGSRASRGEPPACLAAGDAAS